MKSTPTTQGFTPRLSAIPRYLSAVLSQGLVSGFHFVLNLLLVSILLAEDFGVFALTFVIAVMTNSISNALFSTPLCVFAPSARTGNERQHTESLLTTLMAFLLGAGLCLGLMMTFSLTSSALELRTLVAALGFTIAYLARQYSRSVGYARFDVTAVLLGDMMYVVTGTALFSLLLWHDISLTVFDVLTVLTIANALGVLTEMARLPSPIPLLSLRRALRDYRPIWFQSRWALVGAVTTVLVSQAHSLIVSGLEGPAAFAPLAAGFILFGPVRVVFMTIQNVIKPEMALSIAQGQSRTAARQMIMVSVISVAAIVTLSVLTLLGWPLLNELLYQDQYSDEPMRDIVLLWAAITLIAAVQNGPFAALQSLKAFKSLALATVYGSILSLSLVTLAVLTLPIHLSILGVLTAETFVAIWVVFLCMRLFSTLNSASEMSSVVNCDAMSTATLDTGSSAEETNSGQPSSNAILNSRR